MWQIKIHQNIDAIAHHSYEVCFVASEPNFSHHDSFLKHTKQINKNNLEQGGSL